MTDKERKERIKEINALMKALVEEKLQLLQEMKKQETDTELVIKNNLEDMTVEELKQYAKENDYRITSKVKGKIIEQIREYQKTRNIKGTAFR